MQIDLSHEPLKQIAADWILLMIPEEAPFDRQLLGIDASLQGVLTRMRERGDLTGKAGELTRLPDAPGIAAERLLLVGIGKPDALTVGSLTRAINSAVRDVTTKADRSLAIVLPEQGTLPLTTTQIAKTAAICLQTGSVSQQLYRSEPDRFPLAAASIAASTDKSDTNDLQAAIRQGSVIGEAMNLTRKLVNRHPGDLYPESFANFAGELAEELGLECDILDRTRIEQERMHSLLGVAQGSSRDPRVVVLSYRGGQQDQAPLALVGKGVTFDSGGLSLKPNDSMKAMKADMAGAASVVGALSAIARLKLPIHVIGLMGLVENMPSAHAYKLGEVLTARNGVTIEVHNTDAEGRLVLADILAYAVDLGAERLVDLATLTGSCVVALGEEVTGAFTNQQTWCDEILAAAADAGEAIWQMPMFDSFNEQLKSDVADTKNVGTRWGGSITAAKFLEKFVANTPWVHLDIAGPAWADSNQPHRDGGGTGAMVPTLIALAKRLSQQKTNPNTRS